MLNSRQIECFLEAGRLQNFTRAAEALTLPQPAVSRYISSLEEELNVRLFIRENSRRVQLSEEGKIYYNFFQRFSLELMHTRNLLSGEAPNLRLGYNTGWNLSGFLPIVVQKCQEQHPGFRIHLECLDFRELIRGLQEKRLDAVLSMENYLMQEQNLEVERVISIRRFIIYSDLLPGFDQLREPSDFYPYDFFIVDDSRVRQIVKETESSFQPFHFVPRFVTVRNMDTVFACVENGLGVAVLDEWYGNLQSPLLHAMDLEESIAIALASRRNITNPAVEILRETITEFFRG